MGAAHSLNRRQHDEQRDEFNAPTSKLGCVVDALKPPTDSSGRDDDAANALLPYRLTLNQLAISEDSLPIWKFDEEDSIYALHCVWNNEYCQNGVETTTSYNMTTVHQQQKHASNACPIFTCYICLEEQVPIDEAFQIHPCDHTICRSCAHDYIMSHVQSRNFPIHCPLCKAATTTDKKESPPDFGVENREAFERIKKRWILDRVISFVRKFKRELNEDGTNDGQDEDKDSEFIAEIDQNMAAMVLNDEEMCTLERFSLSKVFDSDPRFQHCPNNRCDAVFFNDDPNVTAMKCQACKTMCCWRCKTDTAHEGLTCARYQELNREHDGNREQLRFEEMVVKEKWRRCPSCTMVTAKNEGCNKMACEICKAYWCFSCGKKLSKKRPYLHFTSRWSKCHNKLFRD
ncbi:hypothetical protein BDR26DRAFT_350060 [Obelidium mucronatum]|nr:hypothetical protein BDR26DRAFT_350060 [Obelidium mucronatum]